MRSVIRTISVMVLSICMMISFCACGTPSPTETVDTFLTAVKAQDQETINSVYAGKDFDIISSMDEDEAGGTDAALKDMEAKMLEFDYSLSNEIIKDDKATVDVEIKTYEFGKAMTNAMSAYLEEALVLAFSGASDEQLENIMNDAFKKEIDALKDKSCKTKATINLVQKDGKWKVSSIDDESEIMNALSGNLVNAIKEINESFEEWE